MLTGKAVAMTGVQAAPKLCVRVRPVICALLLAVVGEMG